MDDAVPYTGDELAGVVDLFGGLTREELHEAVTELAFRAGDDPPSDAVDDAVYDAVRAYRLLAVDHDGTSLLVAGPTAFPTLPDHAEDLPHILDVEPRALDREGLGARARERLRSDAEAAVDAGDAERVAQLLDVTYDAEAWAPVDLDDVRATLDRAEE